MRDRSTQEKRGVIIVRDGRSRFGLTDLDGGGLCGLVTLGGSPGGAVWDRLYSAGMSPAQAEYRRRRGDQRSTLDAAAESQK